MINFPVLKELKIENYGLYPGTPGASGLTIDFRKQGLSLVIGANGLGKSTLINIILRVLTGAFDLGKFDRTDELGNLKLAATERADLKGLFSNRVQDQAKNAVVTLVVKFGEVEITIVRSLYDLSLIDLKEGLSSVQFPERAGEKEERFQKVICEAARIADFGDWLLVLHYIVFYQEDRRALVWDTSAQRELLRVLLLDAEESTNWKNKARNVLELDSEFRNLRSSLNKQIKRLRSEISNTEDRKGLRSELESLKEVRQETRKKLQVIDGDVNEKNDTRKKLREQLLLARNELDGKCRDLENAKLLVLESTLPTLSDTAKFIISQIMAGEFCLACGSESPAARAEFEHRLENNICLICGTHAAGDDTHTEPVEMANLRIKKLVADIASKKKSVEDIDQNLQRIEEEIFSWSVQIQEYQDVIRDTTIKIAPIEAFFAKTEEPATKAGVQISSLELIRDERAKDLQREHIDFTDFLKTVEHKFLSKTSEIQGEFNRKVQDFLIEDCEVSWKKVDWRLGQEEKPIEFPAYIFKMRSGTHQVVTERRNPTEVSESQREFIDLAFRIALIQTAGRGGCGSIIMDAPESSLDAVFVERAANVFTEFSRSSGNKLLLASNLVDGNLLPTLLAELYRTNTVDSALVNLFSIGLPSKAVVDYRENYDKYFERVNIIAKGIANVN
jgi:DNA repair exonuclease SbcCD ATPase subunit